MAQTKFKKVGIEEIYDEAIDVTPTEYKITKILREGE